MPSNKKGKRPVAAADDRWPDWTEYVDKKLALSMPDMMQEAIASMPVEHPGRVKLIQKCFLMNQQQEHDPPTPSVTFSQPLSCQLRDLGIGDRSDLVELKHMDTGNVCTITYPRGHVHNGVQHHFHPVTGVKTSIKFFDPHPAEGLVYTFHPTRAGEIMQIDYAGNHKEAGRSDRFVPKTGQVLCIAFSPPHKHQGIRLTYNPETQKLYRQGFVQGHTHHGLVNSYDAQARLVRRQCSSPHKTAGLIETFDPETNAVTRREYRAPHPYVGWITTYYPNSDIVSEYEFAEGHSKNGLRSLMDKKGRVLRCEYKPPHDDAGRTTVYNPETHLVREDEFGAGHKHHGQKNFHDDQGRRFCSHYIAPHPKAGQIEYFNPETGDVLNTETMATSKEEENAVYQIGGSHLEQALELGYLPGQIAAKIRPLLADVRKKMMIDPDATQTLDLSSALTKDEGNMLRRAYDRYETEVLNTPQHGNTVDDSLEEWDMDEVEKVIRSGLLSQRLAAKMQASVHETWEKEDTYRLTPSESREWRAAQAILNKRQKECKDLDWPYVDPVDLDGTSGPVLTPDPSNPEKNVPYRSVYPAVPDVPVALPSSDAGPSAPATNQGLQRSIQQVLSQMANAPDGPSATMMNFTVGDAGEILIDTTSAKDLGPVHTGEDLVKRLKEVTSETEAATRIQAFARGMVVRRKAEFGIHELSWTEASGSGPVLTLCRMMHALGSQQHREVMKATGSTRHPQFQAILHITWLARQCLRVRARITKNLVPWESGHEAMLSDIQRCFLDPKPLEAFLDPNNIGMGFPVKTLKTLFCTAPIFPDDPPVKVLRKLSDAKFYKRLKRVVEVTRLPIHGFQTKGTDPTRLSKGYQLEAFFEIESHLVCMVINRLDWHSKIRTLTEYKQEMETTAKALGPGRVFAAVDKARQRVERLQAYARGFLVRRRQMMDYVHHTNPAKQRHTGLLLFSRLFLPRMLASRVKFLGPAEGSNFRRLRFELHLNATREYRKLAVSDRKGWRATASAMFSMIALQGVIRGFLCRRRILTAHINSDDERRIAHSGYLLFARHVFDRMVDQTATRLKQDGKVGFEPGSVGNRTALAVAERWRSLPPKSRAGWRCKAAGLRQNKPRIRSLGNGFGAVMEPPAPKYALGDRILCLVGGDVRAKGVITRTSESWPELLVDIRQAADPSFLGRTVNLSNVIVVQKLEGFKFEWQRLHRHARFVGFLAVTLTTLLLRIRRRREKEELRLHRLHAPRSCKTCATCKPQSGFSTSQWLKPDGKRTCLECQEAATAEAQKQKEEAQRKELEELLEAECVVCYAEAVPPENRAIFDCAHWICKGCASEMHLRNELKNCPHCRHTISMPHQYVAA